jgi:thioredoxin reductase (NADPH)
VDAPAPEAIATDALIVGAGPVGLFQVFELGLLEIKAQVVDSLPHAGGQCLELYADKPIYDIPALPYCTGRELVERLQQQIAPFVAGFHLGQQVSSVERREDGAFDVATDGGTRFIARTIIVAGGVGSFQPRRLKVEGLDRWRDKQLFYREADAISMAKQHLVIAGAGEAAVAAALAAVEEGAASVTLLHRRDDFEADADSLARLAASRAAGHIAFVAGQASGSTESDGRLTGLVVACNDGSVQTLPLDRLLVLLGWSPKLGPIAEWGMALERKQVVVDTERFETSVPGIHAVGDVNVYPGKRKLIVSGFHEATLAAYAIADRIYPERAQPLLYTTTSPKLHKLLGVEPQV